MNTSADYSRNDERFAKFHALQADLVGRLAIHPEVIRTWLALQPERGGEERSRDRPSRWWRTARLSRSRRHELLDLLARVDRNPTEAPALGAWLLGAAPVRTYLEIAEVARPSLRAIDPPADECLHDILRLREEILAANYGLARTAAGQRGRRDADELLGAALCGLLDAIDRYVPGAKAARFAYFASYWIRYHLSRQIQKYGGVVSFPVNQHRIGRRIERYLAGREAGGLGPPTDREIRTELKLGLDAFYWHHFRPRLVSFEAPPGGGEEGPALAHLLRDPSPDPAAALEEAETSGLIAALTERGSAAALPLTPAQVRKAGGLAAAAEACFSQLYPTGRSLISGRAH